MNTITMNTTTSFGIPNTTTDDPRTWLRERIAEITRLAPRR